MNIYQQKTRLKLILLAIALLIALVTLLYTNYLTSKISAEEENKVKLWAEAIKNKAGLVKSTDSLFSRIENDERDNVQLWAGATQLLPVVEDPQVLTFLSEISRQNTKVPMILVNEEGHIVGKRNIDSSKYGNSTVFAGQVMDDFSKYPPIKIDSRIGDVHILNYLYYQDSKLFKELKEILNGQIESFIQEVVVNSASVPVILTDEKGNIQHVGNIEMSVATDKRALNARLERMRTKGQQLAIDLGGGEKRFIYYENSTIIAQLRFFPFVQFAIFGGFLIISYFAFSSTRKAEQNQVWVGMSKETAHQLGTPISSLSAWLEIIKETPLEELKHLNVAEEMEKDVNRLTLVADRFSKIGSIPELSVYNVYETLNSSVQYFTVRSSAKVSFGLDVEDMRMKFKVNKELFDWVLENLIKNALDAIEGAGSIDITAGTINNEVYIDIEDSGKGIPKSSFDTVFQPGYSTKRRGWGLGLSLSRRIIENYHHGRIFVKESTPGKGTTFRITLTKP
jgi:signal transduction histidine kinase